MARRGVRTLLLAAALVVAPGAAPAVAATDAGAELLGTRGRALRAVDLGTLGGAGTVPRDVNVHGQVVGTSQTADGRWHAFAWRAGRMTDLTPDAADAVALDVSDRGHVVLQVTPAPGAAVVSELRVGRRVVPLGAVHATHVNERGQVAGTVALADASGGTVVAPFRWTRGTRADLGPVPGFEGPSSRVVDLDVHGRVLGVGLGPQSFELGFVWAPPALTTVGDADAFGGNGVVDLADSGWVLGNAFDGGPFLWRDGAVTWLGLPPGTAGAQPVAVDEHGHAVLDLLPDGEGPVRAHLWDGAGYVPIGPPGTTTRAADLDDRHRVVGTVADASEPARTRGFLADGDRFVVLRAAGPGDVAAQEVAGRHVLGTVTAPDGTVRGLLWRVHGGRS